MSLVGAEEKVTAQYDMSTAPRIPHPVLYCELLSPGAKQDAARAALTAAVKQYGYAVVRAGEELVAPVKMARTAMLKWFEQTAADVKQKHRLLFEESEGCQGLFGYNNPSKAKELYRVRRADGIPHGLWPEGLEQVIKAALHALETLSMAALEVLAAEAGLDWSEVRRKHIDTLARAEYTQHEHRPQICASPLDFFYYCNEAAAAESANCHEHVDPGCLTVVPVADVAGLSVLSTGWQK